MNTPGERIRGRRKELGLRQGEFAKLVGIAQGTLSDIERGETNMPSAVVLMKMATVLGVSQAWIVSGKDGEIAIPNDQEQELLSSFREMDDAKKQALMAFLAMMTK
jgi:transcriptional regulator with XRE-family HTH domain